MSNYPAGVTGNEKYFYPDTTVKCSECGGIIDVEQDYYGESIDGERFCCQDCKDDFAMLTAIKTKTFPLAKMFFAVADYNSEEILTGHYMSETQALKRAEELAEFAWEVESYIERG